MDVEDSVPSSRRRHVTTYKGVGKDGFLNASLPDHQLEKRDDVTQNTKDVEAEWLASISQPRSNDKIDRVSTYVYDSMAGLGSTVYVVDTGANPLHEVI